MLDLCHLSTKIGLGFSLFEMPAWEFSALIILSSGWFRMQPCSTHFQSCQESNPSELWNLDAYMGKSGSKLEKGTFYTKGTKQKFGKNNLKNTRECLENTSFPWPLRNQKPTSSKLKNQSSLSELPSFCSPEQMIIIFDYSHSESVQNSLASAKSKNISLSDSRLKCLS